MRFAQIAVSEDSSRTALTGIQIVGDGTTLRLVSTEGHCLILYTIPCEEKINLLMPGRMAKILLTLLTDDDGGFDLTFDDSQILAAIDAEIKTDVVVLARKFNGNFPNWEAVFPRGERT